MNHYSYTIRHRNGWGSGIGPRPDTCATCAKPLPIPPANTGAVGYGCGEDSPVAPCLLPGAPVAPVWFKDAQRTLKKGESITRSLAHCYACCAEREKARMIESGRATLYLTSETAPTGGGHVRHFATDWPGELKFRVHTISKGRHNMARTRVDAWFIGPDGAPWHGVNIGDDQILRCRRLGKGAV